MNKFEPFLGGLGSAFHLQGLDSYIKLLEIGSIHFSDSFHLAFNEANVKVGLKTDNTGASQ